jgi:hypothetical protein
MPSDCTRLSNTEYSGGRFFMADRGGGSAASKELTNTAVGIEQT